MVAAKAPLTADAIEWLGADCQVSWARARCTWTVHGDLVIKLLLLTVADASCVALMDHPSVLSIMKKLTLGNKKDAVFDNDIPLLQFLLRRGKFPWSQLDELCQPVVKTAVAEIKTEAQAEALVTFFREIRKFGTCGDVVSVLETRIFPIIKTPSTMRIVCQCVDGIFLETDGSWKSTTLDSSVSPSFCYAFKKLGRFLLPASDPTTACFDKILVAVAPIVNNHNSREQAIIESSTSEELRKSVQEFSGTFRGGPELVAIIGAKRSLITNESVADAVSELFGKCRSWHTDEDFNMFDELVVEKLFPLAGEGGCGWLRRRIAMLSFSRDFISMKLMAVVPKLFCPSREVIDLTRWLMVLRVSGGIVAMMNVERGVEIMEQTFRQVVGNDDNVEKLVGLLGSVAPRLRTSFAKQNFVDLLVSLQQQLLLVKSPHAVNLKAVVDHLRPIAALRSAFEAKLVLECKPGSSIQHQSLASFFNNNVKDKVVDGLFSNMIEHSIPIVTLEDATVVVKYIQFLCLKEHDLQFFMSRKCPQLFDDLSPFLNKSSSSSWPNEDFAELYFQSISAVMKFGGNFTCDILTTPEMLYRIVPIIENLEKWRDSSAIDAVLTVLTELLKGASSPSSSLSSSLLVQRAFGNSRFFNLVKQQFAKNKTKLESITDNSEKVVELLEKLVRSARFSAFVEFRNFHGELEIEDEALHKLTQLDVDDLKALGEASFFVSLGISVTSTAGLVRLVKKMNSSSSASTQQQPSQFTRASIIEVQELAELKKKLHQQGNEISTLASANDALKKKLQIMEEKFNAISPFIRNKPYQVDYSVSGLPASDSIRLHRADPSCRLYSEAQALLAKQRSDKFVMTAMDVVLRPNTTGFEDRLTRLQHLRADGTGAWSPSSQQPTPEKSATLACLRSNFIPRSAWSAGPDSPDLINVFHGTKAANLQSIIKGIVAVRSTDRGFFGYGVYATTHVEYAAKYARGDFNATGLPLNEARPEDGAFPVLWCVAAVGLCYPLTREADYTMKKKHDGCDVSDCFGEPLKSGHDCHCVAVNSAASYQVVPVQEMEYMEMVFDQEIQVLPIAVLWMKPR